GLGEDQVRSGVGIGLRPVDRRVEALAGTGIGAGADDEVLVAAALDGGLDALGHLGGGDDLFAVEVTAALRVDLVLEVESRDAGVLELLDRAGHIHRLAPAGVGIDEGRQVRHPGDIASVVGHLGHRGQSDVGQTHGRGERSAGDVDALETDLLDDLSVDRIDGAGELDDPVAGEQFAELRAALGRGCLCAQHQKMPFEPLWASLSTVKDSSATLLASRLSRFTARWMNRVCSESLTMPSASGLNFSTTFARATGRVSRFAARASNRACSASQTMPSASVLSVST